MPIIYLKDELKRYLKERYFPDSIIKKTEKGFLIITDFVQGSDDLVNFLKGKNWSISTDGDHVVILIESKDEEREG
jgi:hypothetical protein